MAASTICDAFADDRTRAPNFPADEKNWANKNVLGAPGADWMNPLFGTQKRYRGITGSGIQNLNEMNKSKRRIIDDFGTLQPKHPGRVRSRH
jgi:hypothetical protein